MQALEIGSDKPARSWCFWSTTESIQNDVPSVTAIVETLIAVPLYWWIALQIGMLPSLLISAAVAPLVLLRSEESVALGLRWLLAFENKLFASIPYEQLSLNQRRFLWGIGFVSVGAITIRIFYPFDGSKFGGDSALWSMEIKFLFLLISSVLSSFFVFSMVLTLAVSLLPLPVSPMSLVSSESIFGKGYAFLLIWVGFPGFWIGVLVVTILIRLTATLVYIHLGIRALPRNFRRLTICTSPIQIPEIVPGVEGTGSDFRFRALLSEVFEDDSDVPRRPLRAVDFLIILLSPFFPKRTMAFFVYSFILFFPAWVYRFTIKSTAWFWWPLAFLGDELRRAPNPKILRLNVMDSLWAKTTIATACLSLLAFIVANLMLSGTIFQQNPLLTPLGYLLLIDWTPRLWQILPLIGSLLSVGIVFMLDYAVREYEIAREDENLELTRSAERKFGWIERLSRLRLLLFIVFWLIVGGHAILYFNSHRCLFWVPPKLQEWAQSVYGDRLPLDRCPARIPKAGL